MLLTFFDNFLLTKKAFDDKIKKVNIGLIFHPTEVFMKVKTGISYQEVLNKPLKKKKNPTRPSFLLGTLIKVLSISDLKATNFKYKSIGMEKLGKREPYRP